MLSRRPTLLLRLNGLEFLGLGFRVQGFGFRGQV